MYLKAAIEGSIEDRKRQGQSIVRKAEEEDAMRTTWCDTRKKAEREGIFIEI